MSWSQVTLKYELIRMTEILQSWANFTNSNLLDEILQIRQDLLTNQIEHLEETRERIAEIIINSQDQRLIADTERFLSKLPDKFTDSDPSELASSSI